MPKAKKPAETPETQFKRFQETAEKVGVDPAVAEKVFGILAKKTRPAERPKPMNGKPMRPGSISKRKPT